MLLTRAVGAFERCPAAAIRLCREKLRYFDIFSTLAERLPFLAGRVINSEGRNLFSGYVYNVNSVDFDRNPALMERLRAKKQ